MKRGLLRHEVELAFSEHFPGASPRLFQAPGRVNLIGEHTDYNDGFVLPMAIDRQVILAARLRSDRQVRLRSMHFHEESAFSLTEIEPDSHTAWSNYIRGVASLLMTQRPGLCGMDAVIAGNVPIGSGLSSSAALEVATAVAFDALNSLAISRRDLALLCQRAENEFVGMKCGIMDQLIAALGQRGSALCIDCRSLECEPVPLPPSVAVLVSDTMKRRGLVDSEYNARRRECEEGMRALQTYLPRITALRDVTGADLATYGAGLRPTVRRRCSHVVSENERVLLAVTALRGADVAEFGGLMYQSHTSLRQDYEVSCPELDVMVDVAKGVPGCLGARMTGAGFGGCTVNLVRAEMAAPFSEQLASDYQDRTGITPEIYICQASEGAGEIPAAAIG